MTALRVVNALVLVVAPWALWVRRDTVNSRWDAPITAGIALFALGAALDSPWPNVAAASFPLIGKFYLLNCLGHVSDLLGATRGLKAVALRLMPNDAIGPFMRTRIMAPVLLASGVMLVCLLQSPATSAMPAENLYFVAPDGWLLAYWVTYFTALTGLNAVAIYGSITLRSAPRSTTHDLLVGATALGTLSGWGFFAAIVTGAHRLIETAAWPGTQIAIIGGAVACALSWRHRATALGRRIQPPRT